VARLRRVAAAMREVEQRMAEKCGEGDEGRMSLDENED
jgi:hypothetical protein